MKIDVTPEEAAAIAKALEYYDAYLKSQRREQSIVEKLAARFKHLTGE